MNQVRVSSRRIGRSAYGLDSAGDPWQSRAACGGMEPSLWDSPLKGQVHLRARARFAVNVCHDCPVRRQCHEDAQRHRPRGVIRAGIPYDDSGSPAPACQTCGARVLSGDPRSKFCEDHDRHEIAKRVIAERYGPLTLLERERAG